MSWDWEKLKQQQGSRGGMPPQVDDIVQGLKNFKLPGGPLAFAVIAALLVFFIWYSRFMAVRGVLL